MKTSPFSQATEHGGRPIADYARDLERDGICVFRGLFPQELISRWGYAFDEHYRKRERLPGGLAPRDEGRTYTTLPWRAPFADPFVFAHPVILALLRTVFPQEFALVQLAVDTPVLGSTYQEVHRDYRPLFSDEFPTPLYALTMNFPLVDVTAENGPLEVAKGTHRIPKDVGLTKIAKGEIPLEPVLLARGDVTVRTALALHRGTPNRTREPRPMVALGYVMHWLRTPEVSINIPRNVFDDLPPDARSLLRCHVGEAMEGDEPETYLKFKY